MKEKEGATHWWLQYASLRKMTQRLIASKGERDKDINVQAKWTTCARFPDGKRAWLVWDLNKMTKLREVKGEIRRN